MTYAGMRDILDADGHVMELNGFSALSASPASNDASHDDVARDRAAAR